MTAQLELFGQADDVDEELALRPGDDAWSSCRFCHVLSTAAGVVRHEHGEGSSTCAMYIQRYELVEVDQ